MLEYWIHISPLGTFLATIAWFLIAMPTAMAAYYQSWKARQEARAAREGTLHSANCLEFVAGDGNCHQTWCRWRRCHSLPKPGDVVLLPGHGAGEEGDFFRVRTGWRPSSISTRRVDLKKRRPREARLTKAVANGEVAESYGCAGRVSGARRLEGLPSIFTKNVKWMGHGALLLNRLLKSLIRVLEFVDRSEFTGACRQTAGGRASTAALCSSSVCLALSAA